jgi:hypothetical protein
MKFINRKIILENQTQIIKRPIFRLEEIKNMYESVMKSLDADLKIPKDVLSSFQIKDTLNPKIWEKFFDAFHIENMGVNWLCGICSR